MDDLGISLNFMSKRKNILKIEQLNITAKECIQSACLAMPFNFFKLMIIHLVATTTFCQNIFLLSKAGAGLSNIKDYRQIVLGNVVDCNNIFPPSVRQICPGKPRG